MQIIYEVNCFPAPRLDVADKFEARRIVEEKGEGRIVTFVKGFDGRDRSAAMEVYENGAWRGVNIHE